MSYEYEYDPYAYEDDGHYSEEDYGYESDHTKSVCNEPDWECNGYPLLIIIISHSPH
jgi:hypothetical protein